MKKTIFGLLMTASFVSSANVGKIEEQVYIAGHDKKIIQMIQSHPELTLDHMSKNGFELYGPKGMKAWLCERHNELLRDRIHKIKGQVQYNLKA